MISIVLCVTKPEMAAQLEQNIAQTIGITDFEVVPIDNRTAGYSLCEAYNKGAEQARGDRLLFLHQDVQFLGSGWGAVLEQKLSDPRCGVIGLAGATIKTRALSSWSTARSFARINISERGPQGEVRSDLHNPHQEAFARVVVLDGVFLAMRRDLFDALATPEKGGAFDGQTLRHFHLYDLDISVQAHTAGYQNWVCYGVQLLHYSRGSFDERWYEQCQLFHQKWQDQLPLTVEPIAPKIWQEAEHRQQFYAAYGAVKKRVGSKAYRRGLVFQTIRQTPFRLGNIELLVRLIIDFKK